MSNHGLALIAPLPVNDEDKLEPAQFPFDKQPRSRSRLDALLGDSKRRKSSARFSLASDDTTEATDTSSDRGDDSSTLLTYGNDSCTTSTSARIEKEGHISFFLTELGSMFAEPFSNESLMEQGYDYRDEQTIESAGETVESAEETIDTNGDDDESKYSLNFKAVPVTTNKSDLSTILGKFERTSSNVSKPSSQKKEVPAENDEPEGDMPTNTEEERPTNLDNDPTMMKEEEDNQGIEESVEKVTSKDVEKEHHNNRDDDDYSLNFQTIPTKPKRSDLSALVAKLERRRSKDAHSQDKATPINLEESRDADVPDDKTLISHTRITVESTDDVDSPNECHAEPVPSAEKESSDETVQPNKVAEVENNKEVEAAADVCSIPEDNVTTAPQEAEKSSDDFLSLAGAEYQGFAWFALLGLCAATNAEEGTLQCETTHRALLILDEDDKDIDIPSIECILEEASGTRMCTPKKRQRVKVRAFRGNAIDKKSGLGKVILKLTRKKTSSSSIQL